MKIGDLVRFSNRDNGTYCIVVSEEAYDQLGVCLPTCVMIAIPEAEVVVPMDRKFLKVVSRAK